MKLYVLTRRDLSPSQQAVQAGHAVAEFLLRGPKTVWDNGTLVYLGVQNEYDLKRWCHKLNLKEISYSLFREPDRNNEITSLAAVSDEKVFRSLKLL